MRGTKEPAPRATALPAVVAEKPCYTPSLLICLRSDEHGSKQAIIDNYIKQCFAAPLVILIQYSQTMRRSVSAANRYHAWSELARPSPRVSRTASTHLQGQQRRRAPGAHISCANIDRPDCSGLRLRRMVAVDMYEPAISLCAQFRIAQHSGYNLLFLT